MPFAEDSISASVRLTVCRLYANPIVVLSNRPGVSLSETSGWRAGALALCAALIDNYWNVSWSCETTECVFKHYLRQARGEFADLTYLKQAEDILYLSCIKTLNTRHVTFIVPDLILVIPCSTRVFRIRAAVYHALSVQISEENMCKHKCYHILKLYKTWTWRIFNLWIVISNYYAGWWWFPIVDYMDTSYHIWHIKQNKCRNMNK